MPKYNKVSIIGGDLRQIQLAKLLSESGFNVTMCGFDKFSELPTQPNKTDDLIGAVKESQLIILPLPYSSDEVTINAPFSKNTIYINDIWQNINGSLVVGGRLSDKAYSEAGRHGFFLIDYFEREELAVLNAIPSAEGALQIAMEELPITLHECNTLITGYGRISKLLCKMLTGFSANVTVCARKFSDFAWIKAFGNKCIDFDFEKNDISSFDLVINTVPSLIFGEKQLQKLKDDCLIIDLASKPGGVDLISAGKLGKKVIWALSLPGKVAPITSAKIIAHTIFNILSEEVEL